MDGESELAGDGKKTSRLMVWVAPALELELHRLALADDRKLSEYVGVLLRRHVYGHSACSSDDAEGAVRCDSRTGGK